jgi:hypothetical protein
LVYGEKSIAIICPARKYKIDSMKVSRYFPFVFIYFFVNSVALPFGVTYTALLAPVFYVWILLVRKKEVILPFLAILAPFILIQVLSGEVVRRVYFFSLLNLLLVYIFCQAAYTFFKVCKDVEKIFRQILILNFAFCLVAIIFYFTPWYDLLWIEDYLTAGIDQFRRMRLLTYEPSYYATLFVPIFCFFLWQYLLKQNLIKSPLLLLMLALPYILSFSIGVIGCLFLAWLLTYLWHFTELTKKRRIFRFLLVGGSSVIIFFIAIYLFFPGSALVTRINNILSGTDLSGKGRTIDAYFFANRLLEKGNYFWGIGLGQVKILGYDLIKEYYLYYKDFTATMTNAVAETWVVFGWVGLFLRFFIELFLFVYTKVWSNYFRLMLFLFIFIFQFAGSFITNIAEYVIWILAFTSVFPQFNRGWKPDK